MDCILTTADRELYRGAIKEVLLPAAGGEMAVLPGHAPMVVALKAGVIEVQPVEGEVVHVAIGGGVVEVLPTQLTVLATTADLADDLEAEQVMEAKQRAEQAKKDAVTDEENAAALAMLERTLAQERALERRKRWRK